MRLLWALTMLSGFCTTFPCRAIRHWLHFCLMADLVPSQWCSWWKAGGRGGHSGCRQTWRSVFGDAPCGTTHTTVGHCSGVFGRAALAASCWLTGVERAQSLGLVSLALSVQQLIQYLGQKRRRHRRNKKKEQVFSSKIHDWAATVYQKVLS